MMKNWKTIPLVLTLLLMAALVQAANPIGQVVMLEGSALAKNEEGNERKLEMKAPVYLNDTVLTKESSRMYNGPR